jgi:hypothetical protein
VAAPWSQIFWSKMMASEGVPRGNGHTGKKSAGQNASKEVDD